MIQPPSINARPISIPRSVWRVLVPDSMRTFDKCLVSNGLSSYYCC